MMSSQDTGQVAAALRAREARWTEALADARRRGDRDLVAGCSRNLRAVRREIASRKEES